MSRCRLLLVAAVLSCISNLGGAFGSPRLLASGGSVVSPTTTRGERQLRTGADNSKLTEERFSFPGSELIKKAATSVKNSVKTRYWVHADKSDDYVKKVLKIPDNLEGAALKAHPKYKVYQKYLYKQEGKELDNMVAHSVPSYDVWKELGLNLRAHSKNVKSTEEYRTYARYVNKYDDEVMATKHTIFGPQIQIGSQSHDELMMKVEVWADAKRHRSYVKKMLGLDGTEPTFAKNSFYLKRFDELREAAK